MKNGFNQVRKENTGHLDEQLVSGVCFGSARGRLGGRLSQWNNLEVLVSFFTLHDFVFSIEFTGAFSDWRYT